MKNNNRMRMKGMKNTKENKQMNQSLTKASQKKPNKMLKTPITNGKTANEEKKKEIRKQASETFSIE